MTEILFKSADYLTIRQAQFDLHKHILKSPGIDEIKTCAKHLSLWQQKALSCSSEAEIALLMDYRVYAFRPNGFNMAEKYRRLNQNDLCAYDQALLMRMAEARYAVYQVEATNHINAVTVVDVFIKTRFTLIDHQLAKTAEVGRVIASHIIEFDDFTMQTGVLLPLSRAILQADEVINALDRIDEDHFVDYLLNPINTSKVARAIIVASIRLGHTQHVHYPLL